MRNMQRRLNKLLLRIMVDVNSPASTRVRAADSVLDHAKQAIEIDDIQVRLTALELSAKADGDAREGTK